jgi:L-ascorbate 6-phosphate lactonase
MRDVAYWPKSFLDEIDAGRPEQGARLWALGGPSFVYRTPQTTIWIDPYFSGTPDTMPAGAYRGPAIPINPEEVSFGDVIISTHAHIDHCHGGTLAPILKNTQAFCVGPESSAAKMRGFGIGDDRIRQIEAGDRFQFRDVEFHVYPGYDAFEPRAVTLVLTSAGTALFVSGDTSDGPALEQIGAAHSLECALLAFGRTWYMSEEDLIRVAGKLKPKTLLPFHWDLWRGHTGNLVKLFEVYHRDRPGFDIKMLLVGDDIHLGRTHPVVQSQEG